MNVIDLITVISFGLTCFLPVTSSPIIIKHRSSRRFFHYHLQISREAKSQLISRLRAFGFLIFALMKEEIPFLPCTEETELPFR